uniref:Cuticular protein 84 n=1 Tax=Leptinotarsa decemlineata TaxID=7539 RepID=A0A3Q8HGG7_LEPDE|nr:cuticular protein 84 [Leptinotarsa decemlineata]
MHQRDYIADSAGYRILKSKKVYVGRHTDVGEAIKVAKKYPASAGTLVQSNKRPVITVPYSAGVPPSTYANGPTYPIDRNGKPYSGQNLGNGYDPQYPTYDGVSVTNDGFRYYIPRAYHEEQTLPGEKRSGSFGYIDPFGIRRVIYYNTAPGSGFQHRKNNRYVGFQATPYDPRPY